MDFAGKRHRECWSEAHPKDHLVFLFAQSSPLQNERFLQLLFKSNETSMEFPSSLECFIILHHRLFLLMSLATKTCNCSGKQWCGGQRVCFLLWNFTCSMTHYVTLPFLCTKNNLNVLQLSSCIFLFPSDLSLSSSSLHSASGKTEHRIFAVVLLMLSGMREAFCILQVLFLSVHFSTMFVFLTTS